MGWEPDRRPLPGGAPGGAAGFAHGGPWDAALPSAALAAALEAAAGPEGLYDGADTDALVGIASRWGAIESWAAAGQLATLRAMTRENSDGTPRLRRRDLPGGWDDSLNYEVAGALAMGPVSAGNLAALACTLGTRLPGTGRLLAAGLLSRGKAKLIAAVFEPLDDHEAARAESLILGEVPGKTYYQVERLAWRAALAVAPDAAERRRRAAERDHARVTVFREDSGAVGLSGRDLPAAQALSGHARVLDRAAAYAASGAFSGHGDRALQALAYLDLLNGVTAADAIAFARAGNDDPPDDTGPDGGRPDEDQPDEDGGPGSRAHGSDGPRNGGPDDGMTGGKPPGGEPPADNSAGSPAGGNGKEPPGSHADHARPGQPARRPLPEVTVPLATLLRHAQRPGESRLLGPLDPALTRDLATAAAASPASRWEITVVNTAGHATSHGTARPVQTAQDKPPPAAPALPARVTITVTEELLHRLAAQPRPGAPPRTWHLTPSSPGGPWQLPLPGGRQFTIRLDTVPVYDCDHAYQVTAYLPGDRLRRLIHARDHECTFPTCSRPAHQCDFEHAIPYDQGGATCACNAGARSRRCHQVKQAPGWTLTQPQPGYHQWTTPTGRTYTQEPWRYIA